MSSMKGGRRRPATGSKKRSFDKAICNEGIYANNRLTHAATCLVGLNVQVQVKNGGLYEGVLKTFSAKMDIVLEQAHKYDVDGPHPQNAVPTRDRLLDKVIFNLKDIVTISAHNVDLDSVNKDTFIDNAITSKHNGQPIIEKELKPWDGEAGSLGDELEGADTDNSASNGWDADKMFKRNEEMYKVTTSYDPNLSQYTTPLVKQDTKEWKDREEEAKRIAREIESSENYRRSVALENGDQDDEESKFSAVQRPDEAGGPAKYVPPHLRKNPTVGRPATRTTPPGTAQQSAPNVKTNSNQNVATPTQEDQTQESSSQDKKREPQSAPSDPSQPTSRPQQVPTPTRPTSQSNATVSINDAPVIDQRSYSEKTPSEQGPNLNSQKNKKSHDPKIQELIEFRDNFKLDKDGKKVKSEVVTSPTSPQQHSSSPLQQISTEPASTNNPHSSPLHQGGNNPQATPPQHQATPPQHQATPPQHQATPPQHQATPPHQTHLTNPHQQQPAANIHQATTPQHPSMVPTHPGSSGNQHHQITPTHGGVPGQTHQITPTHSQQTQQVVTPTHLQHPTPPHHMVSPSHTANPSHHHHQQPHPNTVNTSIAHQPPPTNLQAPPPNQQSRPGHLQQQSHNNPHHGNNMQAPPTHHHQPTHPVQTTTPLVQTGNHPVPTVNQIHHTPAMQHQAPTAAHQTPHSHPTPPTYQAPAGQSQPSHQVAGAVNQTHHHHQAPATHHQTQQNPNITSHQQALHHTMPPHHQAVHAGQAHQLPQHQPHLVQPSAVPTMHQQQTHSSQVTSPQHPGAMATHPLTHHQQVGVQGGVPISHQAVTVSVNQNPQEEKKDSILEKSKLNPMAKEFVFAPKTTAAAPTTVSTPPRPPSSTQSPVIQPPALAMSMPTGATYYQPYPMTSIRLSNKPRNLVPTAMMLNPRAETAMSSLNPTAAGLTGQPLVAGNPTHPTQYMYHPQMMRMPMVVPQQGQTQPQSQPQIQEGAAYNSNQQHTTVYLSNQQQMVVPGGNHHPTHPTHAAPHHQATPPHSQPHPQAATHPSPSPIHTQPPPQSSGTPQPYVPAAYQGQMPGGHNGGQPPLQPSPHTPTSPQYGTAGVYTIQGAYMGQQQQPGAQGQQPPTSYTPTHHTTQAHHAAHQAHSHLGQQQQYIMMPPQAMQYQHLQGQPPGTMLQQQVPQPSVQYIQQMQLGSAQQLNFQQQ